MISTPLAPRSEGVRTTKPWLKRCRRNSRMSYPDGVSFRGYGGLTLNKLHRQSANLEKNKGVNVDFSYKILIANSL